MRNNSRLLQESKNDSSQDTSFETPSPSLPSPPAQMPGLSIDKHDHYAYDKSNPLPFQTMKQHDTQR